VLEFVTSFESNSAYYLGVEANETLMLGDGFALVIGN
jgi:hypothetical protein